MTELVSDSSVYEAGYLDADTYMYYIDQTIDGCVSELNPQQVVVNSLPDVDLGADTSIYLGQELMVICDEAGEYTWQDNSTDNSFNFVADDFGVGIHEIIVTVINEANCSYTDQLMVEVKKPLRVDPQSNEHLVLVYPNPNSRLFIVEFSKNIEFPVFISLYDITGQCILNKELEYMEKGEQLYVDLLGRTKGIYILKIGYQGTILNYKIIYK
jgi:hypothetical protein